MSLLMEKQREYYFPYLAMILAQLIFTGLALLSKAAMSGGMSPYVFVFYREAFATVFLVPFTLFFERKKGLPPLPMTRIFFTAFCGDTLSSFLFSISLKYTSATFASASTNAIPAITLLLALLMSIEKLSMKQKLYGAAKLIGCAVCLAGAFMFALYKGPPMSSIHDQHHERAQAAIERSLSTSDWIKGCLIMLAAHTAWSVWLILQGPLVRSYPAKLRVTALQCLCSCVQTAIIAVIFERSPSSWALALDIRLLSTLFGGFSTSVTFWLMTWCIERKGPVFTSAFTPLALIATAAFSAIVWKETLHWGSVGAAALLVIGLYAILWGKNKEEDTGSESPHDQP